MPPRLHTSSWPVAFFGRRVLRVIKLIFASKKGQEKEQVEDYQPSELGAELQRRISQKVILFVLFLLGGTVAFDLIPSFPTELDERAFLGAKQVRY